ncbi:MAG: hypothetical protein FD155_2693 [Bacteroidetes bacterium]|nr:MAG: hypothetical protein FD155_2693 [Bacteroidota bacterium]
MNLHFDLTYIKEAFHAPLFSLSLLKTFSFHLPSHPFQQRCNHLHLDSITTSNKLHCQPLNQIKLTFNSFFPFLGPYKRLVVFKGIFYHMSLKFNIL